ncbi:UNVERIFIED_CONTAM: hypothetical protein FKN15_011674 [Acipenser sinensis]
MCPIVWRSQVRLPVTADRDREFLGGGAQLAERCPGREGLGRQGNPRLAAHQIPLWPIGRLWFCSGAARSVLSSGTIGLVALLWICSAKNDGLARARFGGRMFQPPFPELAGGLRVKTQGQQAIDRESDTFLFSEIVKHYLNMLQLLVIISSNT